MLLMSSFCSSVNFVIREAPPAPGLHCPVTSVEANEPFEDVVGGSCKNKLQGVPNLKKVFTNCVGKMKLVFFSCFTKLCRVCHDVDLAPKWFNATYIYYTLGQSFSRGKTMPIFFVQNKQLQMMGVLQGRGQTCGRGRCEHVETCQRPYLLNGRLLLGRILQLGPTFFQKVKTY